MGGCGAGEVGSVVFRCALSGGRISLALPVSSYVSPFGFFLNLRAARPLGFLDLSVSSQGLLSAYFSTSGLVHSTRLERRSSISCLPLLEAQIHSNIRDSVGFLSSGGKNAAIYPLA